MPSTTQIPIADNMPHKDFVPSKAIPPTSQGFIGGSYGTVHGWSKPVHKEDGHILNLIPKEELHERIEAYKREIENGADHMAPPNTLERGWNKLVGKTRRKSEAQGTVYVVDSQGVGQQKLSSEEGKEVKDDMLVEQDIKQNNGVETSEKPGRRRSSGLFRKFGKKDYEQVVR